MDDLIKVYNNIKSLYPDFVLRISTDEAIVTYKEAILFKSYGREALEYAKAYLNGVRNGMLISEYHERR